MTPIRTLSVWCLDWPVVAAGVAPDVAAAVLHANRVIASSPAARAHDVVVGLRRREAQGRCPQLLVLEHDPGLQARRFEPVLAAIETLTPRIEVTVAGACAFATRGPSRYFGGDAALAERVAALAAEALPANAGDRGCVQVGVADGPFAARLAARHPRAATAPLVIDPGQSAGFLSPLPVGALERPDLIDVLGRLGLHTLGDVAALPAADMVARFGSEGQGAHRLASGLDERPPDARRPPPDLTETTELDPPAERVDVVAFAGKTLADQLHRQLAAQGLACTRVAIAAETEHGEHLERLWRHEGTLTAAAIADRVRWQIDGWLNGNPAVRPTSGIIRLTLTPDQVMAARGRQLGFWGGEAAAGERAGRALARVQALLGAEAVVMPEPRGSRVPVEQMSLVPVDAERAVDERPSPEGLSSERRAPWPGQTPPPSPAVVHPDPLPAEVVDADGTTVHVSGRGLVTKAPARLSVEGRGWSAVVGWAGPWLLDQRWWDPAARRRQARFQILTDAGVAHLLSLEGGRWWVEATYD